MPKLWKIPQVRLPPSPKITVYTGPQGAIKNSTDNYVICTKVTDPVAHTDEELVLGSYIYFEGWLDKYI